MILGLADTVEGLNRGYVVIMAFTAAIPIAMLVPLQLIWLGVTTGTVLVPGCGMGWVVVGVGEVFSLMAGGVR